MYKAFGDFSSDVLSKKKICYARLSSYHQKEEMHVEILDIFYPETEIIKDIGSGLKFKRKVSPLWDKPIQKDLKKLLPCIMIFCEDLILNSSNLALGSLNSSLKRLLERL